MVPEPNEAADKPWVVDFSSYVPCDTKLEADQIMLDLVTAMQKVMEDHGMSDGLWTCGGSIVTMKDWILHP